MNYLLNEYVCDLCNKIKSTNDFYRYSYRKHTISKCYFSANTKKVVILKIFNLKGSPKSHDLIEAEGTIVTEKVNNIKNNLLFCCDCLNDNYPMIDKILLVESKIASYRINDSIQSYKKYDKIKDFDICLSCKIPTFDTIKSSNTYKKFNGYLCRICFNGFCCVQNCTDISMRICSVCKCNFCQIHFMQHHDNDFDKCSNTNTLEFCYRDVTGYSVEALDQQTK